jgi:hypothetical protein
VPAILAPLTAPVASTPGDTASSGASGDAPAAATHRHAREDWQNASPTASQTLPAGVSVTLTGLPLVLASGVVYSIAAGAILVLAP